MTTPRTSQTFRKTLDRRRLELGFTVRGLADACGLSSSAISQILNGRATPTARTRHKLADALKTTPETLFEDRTEVRHV